MDFKLNGKIAIVTGSGRGIGRIIAMTLAREGAKVVINDYYRERAESVAQEIQKEGAEAIPIQADVTNVGEIEGMVRSVCDTWGTIHILINNAGLPAGILDADPKAGMRNFLETERVMWNNWIQLDLIGTLNCFRAVLDSMTKQRYGKIVNIISDAGRIGEPGQVIYSGVKAGIVGFTKALAKEVGRYGINVNCVSAAATMQTYTSERAGYDNPTSPEVKERLEKRMKIYPLARALGRLGLPSDIANTVTFLSSDISEWITGQVLSVNGGYCMVD